MRNSKNTGGPNRRIKSVSFFIVLISAMLFSCKKEHVNPPSPPEKTYNINFKVGFSQSIVPITNSIKKANTIKIDAITSTDTLKKYVSEMYYLVYDSNQHLVRSITQNSTDADFGTGSSLLSPGTYTVVIAAGDSTFAVNPYGNPQINPNPYFYCEYLYSPNPFLAPNVFNYPPFKANTFYSKTTITVGASAASYTVNLNRIVAQLKVVIKDFIPYGANIMELFVDDTELLGVLDSTATQTTVQDYYSLTNLVGGSTNTTFYVIVANTATPFQVEIKCVNKLFSGPDEPPIIVYGDKVIKGVTCKANETTVLTGNLFADGSNAGFTVTYDPTWDTGDPIVVHF